MHEESFITPKDKLGYAEEYIVVNNQLLKYSLSNSLEDIEIAIYARTGHNVDLKKEFWEQNPSLSASVKHLMNKHHVNHSMTILRKKTNRKIIINMRASDNWYITEFTEHDGEFLGMNFLFNGLANYFDRHSNDDSE
ncbi:MAG: hypothetical protein FWD87_02245 [Spirochaetaceae bacterium]|nr:hypothetical protein [Spirochaetaceae bacterium]